LITKQELAYVSRARICPWNQPVLSNETNVSYWRKQLEILMEFKLKT